MNNTLPPPDHCLSYSAHFRIPSQRLQHLLQKVDRGSVGAGRPALRLARHDVVDVVQHHKLAKAWICRLQRNDSGAPAEAGDLESVVHERGGQRLAKRNARNREALEAVVELVEERCVREKLDGQPGWLDDNDGWLGDVGEGRPKVRSGVEDGTGCSAFDAPLWRRRGGCCALGEETLGDQPAERVCDEDEGALADAGSQELGDDHVRQAFDRDVCLLHSKEERERERERRW